MKRRGGVQSVGVDVRSPEQREHDSLEISHERPITVPDQRVGAPGPPIQHMASPSVGSSRAAKYSGLYSFPHPDIPNRTSRRSCSSILSRLGNGPEVYRKSLSIMLAHDPRHLKKQKAHRASSRAGS